MMRIVCILLAGILLLTLAGCGKAPERTDVELGLNSQQARGRRVFQAHCATCHHAYSTAGLRGPGLAKLFQRRYLPSGRPTNNRFVEETIQRGRGMMPPQGGMLTEQEFADLMAYLHTL